MNVKETFISLTDYTYCLGDESDLKPKLPKELEEDSQGNYFLKLGESETMFCCHLDTAAFEKEKVTHDIFQTKKGDTGIGTSGDTLLGADDKAGVVVLMYLIEQKVPGLYYFFIGEESGCVGSRGILRKEEEKFKPYKRVIAFDRRDYGSVITKQMGRVCCSDEFAEALVQQFNAVGMPHKQDPFGIYTDSAIFTDFIQECTNISVGYFHEHSMMEVQNITYLEKLCEAATKIKWEELPTIRELRPLDTPNPKRGAKRAGDLNDDILKEIFYDVDSVIEDALHMYCFNFDNFMPEKEMVYIDYYDEEKRLSVFIHEDGSLSIGKDKFATYGDMMDAMKTYYAYTPKKRGDKSSALSARDFTNNDEYHDFITDVKNDDEPPWWTEKDDLDIDAITSDEDLAEIGGSFTQRLDMQDFIMDLLDFTYEKGRNYLTPKEMNRFLEARNKTIESLVMWLYDRGNNPDKTYGLTWDDDKNRFILDDSGVE